jgi:hypothetical protein
MERATDLAGLIRVTQSVPLKNGDFDTFYVNASEARSIKDPAVRLVSFFNINIKNPQKVLFMGHGGCGKSTELERIKNELGAGFFVTTFSVKDEIDIMDLKYTDLIFIILDKLLEGLKILNIDINPHTLDTLYRYWHDEQLIEKFSYEKMEADVSGEMSIGAKLSFLFKMILSVKGVLRTGEETKELIRSRIEPKISHLMSGISEIIDTITIELKKKNMVPILIIEDLDKLEIPVAEDLFLNHKNILTALNIHIVYTFPIFLYYSHNFKEIVKSFNRIEMLHMIKVRNIDRSEHRKGIDKIKEIILRRADTEKLFTNEALEFIIEKSGGALRDVFEMIQSAALTSMEKKIDKIDSNSAQIAYYELRSSYSRPISRKHLSLLSHIYNDAKKSPLIDDSNFNTNDNLKELLKSLAVIEYNDLRWCDLHPAVEDFLVSNNHIKKDTVLK